MERAVDVGPRVAAEREHVDRERDSGRVASDARVARQVRVDFGTGRACNVVMPSSIGWLKSTSRRPADAGANPALPDELPRQVRPRMRRRFLDPDLAHHQQAQVAYERIGDPAIRDVGARGIEPEILPLQPATVRELDLEVELDVRPWSPASLPPGHGSQSAINSSLS